MRVINFAPNAFITAHSVPEAIILQQLTNRGHDVLQITCNSVYKNYCVSMSAAGLSLADTVERKSNICQKCRLNKNDIGEKFKVKQQDIGDFIIAADLLKIDILVESITRNNWEDLIVEGIPVGRYSCYEFLLDNKLSSTDLSELNFEKLKGNIKNCLITLEAAKKIIDLYKPDRYLTYNSNYSVNNIFAAVAAQHGCSAFTLHAGSHPLLRLSQITITKGVRAVYPLSRQASWLEYRQKDLDQAAIKTAHEHVQGLFNAASLWIYSIKSTGLSAKELHSRFEIAHDKKVVLAMMSSEDESLAGVVIGARSSFYEPSVFETQQIWIEELITWARSRQEITLIIRPHPRGFPNRRESVMSQAAVRLNALFKNLPPNVKINWPADNISVYDLFKIVDLGLNSTSSSAIEMLLFGVPVVGYQQTELPYPKTLHAYAENIDDYFNMISKGLKNPVKSLGDFYEVYKWLAYQSSVTAIDISDVFSVEGRLSIGRGIRFLKRILGIKTYFDGFNINYKKIPTNEYWLTYAITHNSKDHFEKYISLTHMTMERNSSEIEKAIGYRLLEELKKLSKKDPIFRKKLDQFKLSLEIAN